MAGREDKRPKVYGRTPAHLEYDQHQVTVTATVQPQLMSLGARPSVIFSQSVSNRGASKSFDQSLVTTKSLTESTNHNLTQTIGGARPKQLLNNYGTRSNFTSANDLMNNSNNDTPPDSGHFMKEELQKLEPCCEVKFKITGMKKNVLDAKAEFESNHPKVKRKFSLSKDVNNLEIYENGNLVIRVYEANIIAVPAEGIVNAGNQDLNHVGGVARVIAKAAGEPLFADCEHAIMNNEGPLNVSDVVCTTAGNLHFKYIIHAVGPRWSDYEPITKESLKQCSDDLERTVINCLRTAEFKHLESLVISTISSGAFGVPKEVCAVQYAKAILEFSELRYTSLHEIHIVDKNHEMIDIVHKTFSAMITERKPAPFSLSLYVEQLKGPLTLTNEWNLNTSTNERKGFKPTGRDRPKTFRLMEKEVPILNKNNKTGFIGRELLYKSEGNELVCSFASSSEVRVYAGDILEHDGVDAIVCSETNKADAKGKISKYLLENGGWKYRRILETEFRNQRYIGEVITTEGGGNKYPWIIHALVSKECQNVLVSLYRQILAETKTRGFLSIALPLLGTEGEISAVESSEILIYEWVQFCRKNNRTKFTLYLVIDEEVIADIVKDVFKRCIDELKSESSGTDRVQKPQDKTRQEEIEQSVLTTCRGQIPGENCWLSR